MKRLFVINPKAGTQKKSLDAEALARAAGDAIVQICERKEDLDRIIPEARARGCEIVYAVGGDGTVSEIAKRLLHSEMAMGIIPAGSGNGLARHLALPMDARKALDQAQNTIAIDTARVNGIPFVNMFGIGLDAEIAERFANAGTRGLQTYVRVGMSAITDYEAQEYELVLDGRALTRRALLISVANSSQYGNEARIAPHASLTDGLLDVCILSDVSIARAPLLLAKLFLGTIDEVEELETLRAARVTIRRAAEGAAHVDGEPIRLGREIEIEIVPRSLRILTP